MGHREHTTKLVRVSFRSAIVSLAIVLALLGNYAADASASSAPTPLQPADSVIAASPAATAVALQNAAWSSLEQGNGPGAVSHGLSCPSHVGSVVCRPALGPLPPLPSPGPWLNITTLSSVNPGARACYTMTYDPADKYVVLFGGCVAAGASGATWTYSHGVWTQLRIPGPSNRTYAMMDYDAADGYVVLYGGCCYVGNALNDTWKFHAGVWTYVKETVYPKPREAAGMAYDAADGYLVLFGGYSTNNFADLKDTWTYKAGNWTTYTYVNASSYPTARQSPAMAYDPNNQSVVLFGGLSASKGTFLTDTWTFAKGNWSKINATIFPSGRESPSAYFDPLLGHVLLFGGDSLSGGLNDMWAYVGDNWTHINATVAPTKRTLMTFVWDTADAYGLLYGGTPSSASRAYFSDTWTIGLNLTSSLAVNPANIDVGEATTFRAAAVGTSSYFKYSYAGLPPGCTNANVTSITCTPGGSQMAYKVVLTVTDNKSFQVVANTTLSVWTGPSIAAFAVTPAAISLGQTILFNTTAVGGVGTLKYLYTGVPGLPSGCSTHNLTSFTCIPRAKGNYSLLVTVTDGLGGHNNATSNLVVNPDPSISSFAPASTQIDLTQTATFVTTASGGTGGLTYLYTGLPPGCAPSNTASLSCTPSQQGTFNVTVMVTDAAGYNISKATSITINPDPKITTYKVTPASLDLGQAVTFLLNATGGTGTLAYTYTGLPRGCASTNVSFFACTPTEIGPFTVVADVNDLASYLVTGSVTFTVRADPTVASFVAMPAQIDLGQTLTLHANVTGGAGGFTYSYSGLPLGCVLANSPVLNCTPSATGAFVVHLTVHDSSGRSATATTSVSIQPDLTLVAFTISPLLADLNTNTTFTVTVRGGTGAHSYSYLGLPAGCVSVNSPTFYCLPSTSGKYNVSVTVTDAAQFTISANSTMTVNATSTTGPGKSGGGSGISTTDIGIIIAVLLLAAIIGAVLFMRRRPSGGAGAATTEDEGAGEDDAGEGLYGGGGASAEPEAEMEAPPEEEPAPEAAPEEEYSEEPPPEEEPSPEESQ
ncbi:MAG: hypothetical protein L3K19_08955 [Thermoplasmata archaeon]|nr:hypothetical protein [Thermoplasmata archaeon]